MKIAWFTPFNERSAIGRYSKYAAQALSKYASVDLFLSEHENLHSTNLSAVYYNPENVLSLLKNYDICIYNIGDYAKYHAPIYEVMRKHRGVVISHDLCLHNFFWEYYMINLQKPEEYMKSLTGIYGTKDAHMILEASRSFRAWSELNLLDYHMTELIYPFALGLVVHSDYHASRLKLDYSGPVGTVPLVYGSELNSGLISKNFDGYDSSKVNLLTVGNINPNKRIHSAIETIGSDPNLRQYVHLTCIGSLDNKEYVNRLREQISEKRLDKNINLLGFIDYKRLADYYAHADMIVNMRYPAYEGGSASLVEQMQLGKPVIVSDTGVYSEMPDNCVIKINPKDEVKELKNVLSDIVRGLGKWNQYGINAKAYADMTFSLENYGKTLYEFIRSVCFLGPLYSLSDLLGQEMRFMGISPDMRICGSASRDIETLFGTHIRK